MLKTVDADDHAAVYNKLIDGRFSHNEVATMLTAAGFPGGISRQSVREWRTRHKDEMLDTWGT